MALPSEGILQRAAARFHIDMHSIALLRDAANTVYACTRRKQPCVLRLTRASERDRDDILGELHWLEFLSSRSVNVALPLRSEGGELVPEINDGHESYWAALFEKIPGVHPAGDLLTDETLYEMGRVLGQIHRIGKSYVPSQPAFRRPHWHELGVFRLDHHIPASQTKVREQCRATLDHAMALPKDGEAYGLIHADPEPWNMLFNDGAITLIDFEECCHGWYAFDVAVAVMYSVWAAEPPDQNSFARQVWHHFYHGYRSENRFSNSWVDIIPTMMRLRVMEDYAFHIRLWQRGHREPWLEPLIVEQREMIENGAPVFDIDFAAATRSLCEDQGSEYTVERRRGTDTKG